MVVGNMWANMRVRHIEEKMFKGLLGELGQKGGLWSSNIDVEVSRTFQIMKVWVFSISLKQECQFTRGHALLVLGAFERSGLVRNSRS